MSLLTRPTPRRTRTGGGLFTTGVLALIAVAAVALHAPSKPPSIASARDLSRGNHIVFEADWSPASAATALAYSFEGQLPAFKKQAGSPWVSEPRPYRPGVRAAIALRDLPGVRVPTITKTCRIWVDGKKVDDNSTPIPGLAYRTVLCSTGPPAG
jgi:hypothetical protein